MTDQEYADKLLEICEELSKLVNAARINGLTVIINERKTRDNDLYSFYVPVVSRQIIAKGNI